MNNKHSTIIFIILLLAFSNILNINAAVAKSKWGSWWRRYKAWLAKRKAAIEAYKKKQEAIKKAALEALKKRQAALKKAKEKAKEQSLHSQYGFGFKGVCTYDEGAFDTDKFTSVPEVGKSVFNDIVLPAINELAKAIPQYCLGNFYSEELGKKEALKNGLCDKIPVPEKVMFGITSFYNPYFVCPAAPTTPAPIGGCFLFDREGTVAVTMSSDILGCAIAHLGPATMGIATIFSQVLKLIDNIGIGFSLKKKFEREFNICYNNNGSPQSKKVTGKGHFYFETNFGIPDFKIGKIEASKFVGLNGRVQVFIDLGNTFTDKGPMNNLIESFNKRENIENFPATIKNLGAELTYCISGFFTIKLKDATKGFMQDIEDLELFDRCVLLTQGKGSTGVNAGLYVNFDSTAISSIVSIFTTLLDKYLNTFGLNLKIPDIPKTDLTFGIFIDSTSSGFSFDFYGNKFQCIWHFDKMEGSCQYKQNFFTAFMEGVEWVVKEAKKLFDKAGKEITRFAANAGTFFNSVGNEAKKSLEDAKRIAEEAAAEAKRIAEEAAAEAKRIADEAATEAAEKLRKAEEEAARVAAEAKRIAEQEAARAAAEVKRKADAAAKEAQRIKDEAARKAAAAAAAAKRWFSSW